MVIDRALFAQECIRQGVFFGVNPHYILGVRNSGPGYQTILTAIKSGRFG